MPEHDNDKLEHFFQKAASKPDISFNEDDWKKLEARLDAEGMHLSVFRKNRNKIAGAVVLTAVLIFSGVYWLNSRYGDLPSNSGSTSPHNDDGNLKEGRPARKAQEPAEITDIPGQQKSIQQRLQADEVVTPQPLNVKDNTEEQNLIAEQQPIPDVKVKNEKLNFNKQNVNVVQNGVEALDDKKIFKELIQTIPPIADKIKQKAGVKLPGAEEEDLREADAIVKEEHASGQKHLASPRLSLLLSLAPDFSSTSLNQYTAPGKAYGVMIHYHIKKSWSASIGIVKNNKQYTGDGEDYKPPKGYWKYYTNGIIPNSIDGSCTILEFPVMLQYTVAEAGKSRILVGAGASSYVILDESYRYYFEEPNPGARVGWDSRNSSRFVFNMVNFTIGYERQFLPGFMVGVEPYVKIPIEEIGWSSMKLFSAGASITLRYNILKKEYASLPIRSRGPD